MTPFETIDAKCFIVHRAREGDGRTGGEAETPLREIQWSSKMTDALFEVESNVSEYTRLGEQLVCNCFKHGQAVKFIAEDDGWHLTLTAAYHPMMDVRGFKRVLQLLNSTRWNTPLFTVEPNESMLEVRAVFRLPIYVDARLEDDVPAAIRTIVYRWIALNSLIDRAAKGKEKMVGIVRDAELELQWLMDECARPHV